MSIEQITIKEAIEWKKKAESEPTIGHWKKVGRELRDRYGLTDMQAIDILNGRFEKVFK